MLVKKRNAILKLCMQGSEKHTNIICIASAAAYKKGNHPSSDLLYLDTVESFFCKNI